MKTIVFWLIGSNACGKSTQARKICEELSDGGLMRYKISKMGKDSEEYYEYTTFIPGIYGVDIANLGRITNQQCSGTDTLGKKQHIINSYLQACEDSDVIVIDSIMATAQFYEFIRQKDVILFTVLLDYLDPEDNFSRLKLRRAKKKAIRVEDVELDEKTKINVSGKIRGFKSLFDRVKVKSDIAMCIPATNSIDDIFIEIMTEFHLNIEKWIK
jgi:hypothetical protein